MNRINPNEWLAHEGDKLLTWLHESEEEIKTAIYGIGLFMVKKIPAVCRRLLRLLKDQLIYACRVATRVARLAGLGLAWLGIVAGPLAVCPCIITGVWVALALAGSWWGFQRQAPRQQRVIITEVKGVRRG